MRFAWLKENKENYAAVQQAATHPLAVIRKVYNLVFWFFLIPFFKWVDFGTGFVLFTIIIGVRLIANLMTNNILNLTPEEYDAFPFRIP
jgi:hypothetical protein